MVGLSTLEMVSRSMRAIWTDRMSVRQFCPVENPVSKITRHENNLLYENKPCRLSFSNSPSLSGDRLPIQNQIIKVFCDETLDIPPGSTIAITRQDKTVNYYRSGVPALYPTHQEIILDLEDRHG